MGKNYRADYLRNRERILERARAYHKRNKQRIADRKKSYESQERNRIRRKFRIIKNKFNISESQWHEALFDQGNACAICRNSDFGHYGPVIDHCHVAGHFRGLLCSNCNTAIGLLRNNPMIMENARTYLLKEELFNSTKLREMEAA